MPEAEKAAIKKSLNSSLISMERWMNRLSRSEYNILCIGELHEESTRKFVAEEFFAKFSVDALLLEATPKQLKRLTKRLTAGRTYFPLLGANIMNILRTVRTRNPDIRICGIEETDKQQKEQHGLSGSRDKSIASIFWNRFQPDRRHILLFGALHCAKESNWLFGNLYGQASPSLKKRMLNVQVLGEHQNGPVEAFVFFLDEIGIVKKNYVIPDTRALHPHIYELFQALNRQTLEKFCTLIVFRT